MIFAGKRHQLHDFPFSRAMSLQRLFVTTIIVCVGLSFSNHLFADEIHPGKIIYDKNCAVCHDKPAETKAPSFETLTSMRVQALTYAITEGKMQAMAAALNNVEKTQLVTYLAGTQNTSDAWVASMMCSNKTKPTDFSKAPVVQNFGFDLENHRNLTSQQAGLSTKDFANLELAWVMAFPKATTMRSQAAVVDNTLFLPVAAAAKLFAIDISAEPCFKWVYNSPIPLRTSAAYGKLANGRPVITFADLGSTVHLLDAATGKLIWTKRVAISEYTMTTGTPVIYDNKVVVPLSQYEISLGGNPTHQCCTSHGGVTALHAETGETLWTAHALPDAKPVRDRGDGKMIWGPSGAPIWNSPTIDSKRGVVYVGTGEATSEPAHEHTDAILAIDLKDGALKWHFQATEKDIFVMGCGYGRDGLNCPKPEDTVARDVDFGASVIIGKNSKGKELLFAGQKSGTVWALDPENGKVVWRKDIGEGSPLGGIHWGIAYDGKHIYAPINRPFGFRPGPNTDQSIKPGLYALNVDTGEIEWSYLTEPDCSGDRKTHMKACANNIGFSGAPTVIDGAVVTGSLDGFIRAFDTNTGKLLFQFDTSTSFDAINGVEAKGGSIDNASIIAHNGYLFVNSGYGMFGQVPGNVMLAFKVKPAKK